MWKVLKGVMDAIIKDCTDKRKTAANEYTRARSGDAERLGPLSQCFFE